MFPNPSFPFSQSTNPGPLSMMIRGWFPMFLCMAALTLSGCFEVLEEVDMNLDGSGHVKITFNLSQSKTQLKSIMLLDSINGYAVPKRRDLEVELATLEQEVKRIPGISGVSIAANYGKFVFAISGDFQTIHSLNLAINEVGERMNRTPYASVRVTNFGYENQVFNRHHRYIVDQAEYRQIKPQDRIVVEGAHYLCIYRFPVAIQSYSHPRAILSKSGKSILLRSSVKRLIKGKETVENQISLRP